MHFTGVYLTEDVIVRHATPLPTQRTPDLAELEQENRRLRAELEHLKRRDI